MSEDITIDLSIRDNIEQSRNALDRFSNTIRDQISTIGTFETEVLNFGSAMALAMEAPIPRAGAFFSLLKVGADQAKKGGIDAARGISAMGLAVQGIAERIPAFRSLAPVFGKISDYAKTAGGVIGWVKGQFSGMQGDMARVMQMTSDMGEALRVQAYTMQSVFQDRVTQIRAVVSETQQEVNAYEKLLIQQGRLLAVNENEKIATQAKAAALQGAIALRQRDLDLAKQQVVLAEKQPGDAIAANDRLRAAELQRDKILGDIAKKQTTLQELQQRSNDLDSQSVNIKQNLDDISTQQVEASMRLAKAQDAYNRATRVQGPLLKQANSHIMDIRTSLKRLEVGWMDNEKVNERWVNQATRALRLYQQEADRLRKAGVALPPEFARSFAETSKLVDLWRSRLKQQQEEQKKTTKTTDDLAASTDKYGKSISKIVGKEVVPGAPGKAATAGLGVAGGAMAGVGAQVSATTQVLTRSLGNLHPVISSITNTVQQFGGTFSQQMSIISSSAANMAQKTQGSFLLLKGGIIAAGAAAIGFIKKTGMVAAEYTTLNITMQQIATNVAAQMGVDTERFVGYIETVRDKLKGIAPIEATEAVTTFLRAELPIDRLQELAEAAKNFGVTVKDMSSSQVLGRFVEVITSGNTSLLKGIGIMKTVEQMYEDYGKTIGKTSKEMNSMEKQTAIIEGILGQVSLSAGVYEKAMETAGKQLSSFSRLVQTAAIAIGSRFEPILSKVIFTANKFLEWFTKLPDPVMDALANVIKLVAGLGSLVGVLTVAGPVLAKLAPMIKLLGMSLKVAVPQALAIGLALKGLMLIVGALRRVWDEDLGGIRSAVALLKETIDNTIGPIVESAKFWIGAIRQEIQSIISVLTGGLANAIGSLSWIVMSVRDVIQGAFVTIMDTVNGFGRAFWSVFRGITAFLRGDTTAAFSYFKNAVIDVLTTIALLFDRTIKRAAVWGWNLIVQVANGITEAATSVIAKVMNFVGNLIGRFLAPGSPPKEGPLHYIAQWGKGVINTFLKAFETADFGALNNALAPIKQALQAVVQAGKMTQKEMTSVFMKARAVTAELLARFRQTGEISEDAIQRLAATLGKGSEEYVKYIRLTLEYQKALKALEVVEQEVEEAQKAGFVSKDLKNRLEAAQAEVEAKKDAVDWQREYLAAIQETADLQAQMMKDLKDAMDKVGKGVGDVADALKEFKLPELDQKAGAPDWLADPGLDKMGLGKVSEEFEAMRLKVVGLWQAASDFLKLPWSEKLELVKGWLQEAGQNFLTWLGDITGIDVAAQIEKITALPTKAIEWLEKITGWDVSSWVDEFTGAIEEAWNWVVKKTQWLYDTLVGKSLIPDTVDGINDEFEKITIGDIIAKVFGPIVTFFQEVKDTGLRIIGKIVDFFIELGKSIKAIAIIGGLVGIVALVVKFGTVIGFLATQFLTVVTSIASFASWVGFLATYFGILAAPILGIAAAIGAVIYGIVSNKDQVIGFWQDFRNEMLGMWNEVKPAMEEIWSVLQPILKWIGIVLASIAGVAIAAVISAVQSLWDVVKVALPYIARIFSGVFSIIYGIIKMVVLPVFSLFAAAIAAITGDTENAKKLLLRAWTNFKEGFLLIMTGVWTVISNVLFGILNIVVTFVASFIQHIGEWIIKVLQHFGLVKEGTLQIWQEMWQGIHDWLQSIFSTALNLVVGLYNLFTTVIGALAGKVMEIWTGLWGPEGTIMTAISDLKSAGGAILENIWQGISDKWEWFKGQVVGIWQKFRNLLPGSEPEDTTSPLAGLGKSGEATLENFAQGLTGFDLQGILGSEISGLSGALTGEFGTATDGMSDQWASLFGEGGDIESILGDAQTGLPLQVGSLGTGMQTQWDTFMGSEGTLAGSFSEMSTGVSSGLDTLGGDISTWSGTMLKNAIATMTKLKQKVTELIGDVSGRFADYAVWFENLNNKETEFMWSVATEFELIGNAITENLMNGIISKWPTLMAAVREKTKELRDELPGSEPKDPTSPLRNLGKAGEAMMTNFARGMDSPKLERLFNNQLAQYAANLGRLSTAAAGGTTATTNSYFYRGAFEGAFPNVKTREDATGIEQYLTERIGTSKAKSYFGGFD